MDDDNDEEEWMNDIEVNNEDEEDHQDADIDDEDGQLQQQQEEIDPQVPAEQQQEEEQQVQQQEDDEIVPPRGQEMEFCAIVGRLKRWALQNGGDWLHISTVKFEILAQRAYKLYPRVQGEGLGFRADRWNWLWNVLQNQGWRIFVAVDNKGSKGAKVREVVDPEEIKTYILEGILDSYAKATTTRRTRFDDAQEGIITLANGNDEIARFRNEVARMTRADGVLNVPPAEDGEFGGLGGGGGLDDEDPLADAPPKGGIGWGKKLVAGIVVTLLCYSAWSAKNVLGDIFSSSGADSTNGSIGEGNVSSPPSSSITKLFSEEEVTNGTDSSYTDEEVDEEENNVSDIEVPLICTDMWKCGDIPQSLFMFTRDVSIPATEHAGIEVQNQDMIKVVAPERDWIWVMPLLIYQRLEAEKELVVTNRKHQDTVATYESEAEHQLARIDTLKAEVTQQLASVERLEAKDAQQFATIERYKAKDTQHLSRIETYKAKEIQQLARIETLEKVCAALCLVVLVCVCGVALASIIEKNGKNGDSDGEQQPTSDDAAPDLAHANSTDSDTLAGETASPDPRRHSGWRRIFITPTVQRYGRN